MEEKNFLDEKVNEITELRRKIYEEYPADRSKEMQNELWTLEAALDAYIIEYGGTLRGEDHEDSFETCRLPAYEDEENPVVICSTTYYKQYNQEIEQYEVKKVPIERYYDVNGEPDDTYDMGDYFPDDSNVEEYLETGHVKFDMKAIEQILEKYNSKLASKEGELSSLEDEEKTITEAEKLVDKQSEKEDNQK